MFHLVRFLAIARSIHGSNISSLSTIEKQMEPLTSSGCGTERWSVKTGTDADIGLVNQSKAPA